MSDKRRLIYAFVEFLNREMASDEHSEDAKESLEVASQCLQTAYSMSAQDDKHLSVSKNIEEIFKEATKDEPLRRPGPASAEDKEKAEKFKAEGNEMMKSEQFDKALELYTKAIELDPSEKIFYCNRAAAHSKLGSHFLAVEDCQRAIDMDPNYSKAYGRMGLAYSSLDKHKEAVDCFTKALTIEPSNDSYQTNLNLAKEKLQSTGSPGQNPFAAAAAAGAAQGAFDLQGMLGNPALMNMATSLMADPNMQAMMGQLMQGGGLGGLGGLGGAGNSPNIDNLLQAGQRLAEEMQQSNPELVEQLRQQMGGMGGGGGGNSGPENKDNNKPSDDSNPPPGTS